MAYYSREFVDQMNMMTPIADLMREEGERVVGSGRTLSFFCSKCNGDAENSKINTEKNFFTCFRCEKVTGKPFQGPPNKYLELKYGWTFTEAIEFLAHRNKVALPANRFSKEDRKEQQLFRDTMRFYETFWDASDYLVGRGVAAEVIRKYRIGYAPGGGALRAHLEKKGYSLEYLVQSGLVKPTGIDTFFARAVVPLTRNDYPYDFYSRRIDSGKWLKHLVIKGQFMAFGEDNIPIGCETLDIYESVINKLVAESAGFPHGFAIGGCGKFSIRHIHLILKLNPKRVRLILDPDAQGQGQRAALQIGELIVNAGIPVDVVLLPLGQDAAQLIALTGASAFQACLDSAMGYEAYRAHFLMKSIPLAYIEEHLKWRWSTSWSTISQRTPLSTLFWESSQS